VVEIWSPNKEAGITDYKWIDWYRDHPVEDDLKLLKWSDEQCGGQAHVDWQPFRHPQLGHGRDRRLGQDELLAQPAAAPARARGRAVPGWMTQLGLSLPKLELLRTEVRALGPDTWRVRLAVANSGWLPAYVSQRALERKTVRGTVFNIHLPAGASLVSGLPREVAGHLEGHAPKSSQQAFLPTRELTGDRAVAEWIVKAPVGTRLALTARADRAGAVHAEVTLD
jgi:hypothetical protein